MWLYKGAWGVWDGDYNCFILMNDMQMQLKLSTIRAHFTQDPPVVGGTDNRTFEERAVDITQMNSNKWGEKFFVCTPEEFTKLTIDIAQKESDIPIRKCSIVSDVSYKRDIGDLDDIPLLKTPTPKNTSNKKFFSDNKNKCFQLVTENEDLKLKLQQIVELVKND